MRDAMRTRGAVSAALAGVVALALSAPASAETIAPNTVADVVAPADGLCSLREAITAAFTHNPSGGGAGECKAGTGDDLIDLGPERYVLAIPGSEDLNASGDLDVRSALTIRGDG